MFLKQDLDEGSGGMIDANLIRPVSDQIRPSNRITGPPDQVASLSHPELRDVRHIQS
jgi:hypothetical protein